MGYNLWGGKESDMTEQLILKFSSQEQKSVTIEGMDIDYFMNFANNLNEPGSKVFSIGDQAS